MSSMLNNSINTYRSGYLLDQEHNITVNKVKWTLT